MNFLIKRAEKALERNDIETALYLIKSLAPPVPLDFQNLDSCCKERVVYFLYWNLEEIKKEMRSKNASSY